MSGLALWRYLLLGLLAMGVLAAVVLFRLRTEWWRAFCTAYVGLFYAVCLAGMTGWGIWLGIDPVSVLILSFCATGFIGLFVGGLRSLLRQLREERQGSGQHEDL